MHKKHETVAGIKRGKAVAIIRGVENRTDELLGSLLRGGITSAEFTFGGDDEKIAQTIKNAVKKFGDEMYIGAGTVTTEKRLFLALEAGAAYVITPVCDVKIAEECKKADVCSIIGAFTPTEIKTAVDAGADFVKLFPANFLGADYVKAILAPLKGTNVIVFGGITTENIRSYLEAGAVAAGIGADLVDKKSIESGKFDIIEEKARKYYDLVADM